MNCLLLAISMIYLQTDSLTIDSIPRKYNSIMFQKEIKLKPYKYNHIQGFFCDFEDELNKNKKIRINLGVGDQ